ncbi:MAG: hypothetical protein ACKV2V_00125 [Blastocatellia bacterium]
MQNLMNRLRHNQTMKIFSIMALAITTLIAPGDLSRATAATRMAAAGSNLVLIAKISRHLGDDPNLYGGAYNHPGDGIRFDFDLSSVDTSRTAVLMVRTRDVDYPCNEIIINGENVAVNGALSPHPDNEDEIWFTEIIEIPSGRLKNGANSLIVQSVYQDCKSYGHAGGDWDRDDFVVDSIFIHYSTT